ncbi:MAG: hypothetical protein LBR91_03360 [Puniceicoccales bacterium]|nr:hypothetical protein [Puniceicoccales bacterium]
MHNPLPLGNKKLAQPGKSRPNDATRLRGENGDKQRTEERNEASPQQKHHLTMSQDEIPTTSHASGC